MFFKTNIYVYLFFFIYLFFFKSIFINTHLLDSFFRVNFNDSFLNLYSFFWTNFWYLILFYLLLFCIILILIFNFNLFFFLFLIILFLYNFEINNFFLNNLQFINLNSIILNFNVFLLNNINKYHPFLFYISTLLILLIFLYLSFYYVINLFYFNKEFNFFKINSIFKKIFYINILSLFLGSWWALQEGSWGGWWNWDASETLGLLVLISAILFFHLISNYDNFMNNFYFLFLWILFIVLTYYFIQLNFDLVSHNFGIKFFFFF